MSTHFLGRGLTMLAHLVGSSFKLCSFVEPCSLQGEVDTTHPWLHYSILTSSLGTIAVLHALNSCASKANFILVGATHDIFLVVQNLLESLLPLEAASNLRFLTVAGNKLTSTRGLEKLEKLLFLDVSDNLIQHLNPGKGTKRHRPLQSPMCTLPAIPT